MIYKVMKTFRRLLRETTTADYEDEIFAALIDDSVSQSAFNTMLKKWIQDTNPVLAGQKIDRQIPPAYNTTYLSGQLSPSYAALSAQRISEHGFSGLGLIVQPFTYHYLRTNTLNNFDSIGIDNGMFTKAGRENFSWDMYEKMVKVALAQEKREVLPRLNFFTVPDEPFDWAATLKKFKTHESDVQKLRGYGAPVAICVQNGATVDNVPFDKVDVIFIGGDDKYKVGEEVEAIVKKAQSSGKQVHMGRVNGTKRLNTASQWQTDTADGTYLTHELAKALHEIERQNPKKSNESDRAYSARLQRILSGKHIDGDLHPKSKGYITEPEIVSNFVNYVVDNQHNNHLTRRYNAIVDLVKQMRGRPLNKRTIWEYDRFLPQVPGMEHDEDVVAFDSVGNVIVDNHGLPVKNQELFAALAEKPKYRGNPEGIPADPKEYMPYINRYIRAMRNRGVMPH
jgi:hypothetical protein